jgi:acetyltransferase-like isoleucine patch superfamily enzyme
MLEHDWYPEPLPGNVTLGERSWCYSSFAFVHYESRKPAGLKVGHDSGIYHRTFFDLGASGEVEIGNYCAIVGAIFSTNARIEVGDYTFISHDVVLADSFAAVPFSSRLKSSGGTVITLGENCWVGARAVLLAGAKIGDNAIVGAAAVVDFEVPAGATVVGNPGRIVAR